MNIDKSIRGAVEAEASALCKSKNVTLKSFNQDLCAVTCINVMAKYKTVAEKLQVAYVCSNASALRQAISSEKKQEAVQIASDLLGLVKEK